MYPTILPSLNIGSSCNNKGAPGLKLFLREKRTNLFFMGFSFTFSNALLPIKFSFFLKFTANDKPASKGLFFS